MVIVPLPMETRSGFMRPSASSPYELKGAMMLSVPIAPTAITFFASPGGVDFCQGLLPSFPALTTIIIPFSYARNEGDRKSTRLNSSHVRISYAVFRLKKKQNKLYREIK